MKRAAPYLIGIGLVLFVIHNIYQPLLNYIFLPHIGVLFIMFGAITVLQQIKDWKQALGEKKLWIPLAIIAVSIASSGIESWVEGRENISFAFGAVSLGILLFGLYVASRLTDREKMFKPFAITVVIESVSIVVWAATHNWIYNGGLVSPTNYDIATGVVVFGILVSPQRHQWWLATIGATGLMFAGSGEAIFVGVVMLLVIGIRRTNWNWKLLAPIGAIAITLAITIPTGIFEKIQAPNIERLEWASQLLSNEPVTYTSVSLPADKQIAATTIYLAPSLNGITGYRLENWKLTMPIKPFGYGINLVQFYKGIPHNIALIIIEQVGVVALLAWLWVAWLGIKTKETRYLWVGFLALGILDHFIWTQAAPWFWTIAGVISSYTKGGKV